MQISEIKKWAKEKGYTVIKDKEDGLYYWAKLDAGPDASGVAKSVSKVARAIFNHMTDNKWVEYQEQYQKEKEQKELDKFNVSDYGS
jgi:hypothetical protein